MNVPPAGDRMIYQHSAELLGIHEALLDDGPRNLAFAAALEAHVTADSVVLDIGSGTGLWAVFAAKLGARRVVAVEREGLMCGVIHELARANGVADRIEVVHADAFHAGLQCEFDVVVSETIGHLVFDEQVVSLMIAARERFLKPGGAMIPERVSLVAAPVTFTTPPAAAPVGMDLNFAPFRSLALHRPLAFTDKSRFAPLAEAKVLVHADMTVAAAPPCLSRLAASWENVDASRLGGVAVWVEMGLTEKISLSTLDTPSWSATVYRLAPFAAANGDLGFDLALDAGTNYWNASLAGETQRFSPAIAATRMALPRLAAGHLPIHGSGPVFA